jgi:hypothetical protein
MLVAKCPKQPVPMHVPPSVGGDVAGVASSTTMLPVPRARSFTRSKAVRFTEVK